MSRFGLLRDSNFRKFYIGHTLSQFGNGMEPIGIAFAVLAVGGTAGDLGLVLTGGVAAGMLCMIFGGTVADRFGWQRTMIIADVVRCLAELAFAMLIWAGHPAISMLVLLYLVMNLAGGFYMPAAAGLTPHMVKETDLQQANVLIGFANDFGRIFGPVIAGGLVLAVGPAIVLAIDSGTFAVSVVSLALLRLAPFVIEKSQSMLRDLRDGWSAWRSRDWVWITCVKYAIFNAVVLAPVYVLGPLIAKESLNGAGSWGIILAAQGVGSVAIAPLLMKYESSRPLLFITAVQLAWTFPVVSLALTLSTPLIAAASFVAGMGAAAFNAVWATTLQRNVPGELMARVTAYSYFTAYLLSPIGLALAASVAGAVGTDNVMWFAAAWQVVSTLFVLALPVTRRFRNAALPKESELEPA